jgi:hypothetical protein
VSARLLTCLYPNTEGMLSHLVHFEVTRSADALKVLETPALADQWVVFHFPQARLDHPKALAHHKAALYGRMWKFRERGIDAMVRTLQTGKLVLVARRYA